jgi:hypothetical protein
MIGRTDAEARVPTSGLARWSVGDDDRRPRDATLAGDGSRESIARPLLSQTVIAESIPSTRSVVVGVAAVALAGAELTPAALVAASIARGLSLSTRLAAALRTRAAGVVISSSLAVSRNSMNARAEACRRARRSLYCASRRACSPGSACSG